MRPVHSRLLSETESAEFLMREIRSECFFFNRRAPETVFDLSKMSLGWIRKLLGQERRLHGHHAVLKPEVGEAIEIKDEDEEAVVYGDPRRAKRRRCE